MALWSTSFSGRFTRGERSRVPLDMRVFRSSKHLNTAETSLNLPKSVQNSSELQAVLLT
jgi:hypothetical protein